MRQCKKIHLTNHVFTLKNGINVGTHFEGNWIHASYPHTEKSSCRLVVVASVEKLLKAYTLLRNLFGCNNKQTKNVFICLSAVIRCRLGLEPRSSVQRTRAETQNNVLQDAYSLTARGPNVQCSFKRRSAYEPFSCLQTKRVRLKHDFSNYLLLETHKI